MSSMILRSCRHSGKSSWSRSPRRCGSRTAPRNALSWGEAKSRKGPRPPWRTPCPAAGCRCARSIPSCRALDPGRGPGEVAPPPVLLGKARAKLFDPPLIGRIAVRIDLPDGQRPAGGPGGKAGRRRRAHAGNQDRGRRPDGKPRDAGNPPTPPPPRFNPPLHSFSTTAVMSSCRCSGWAKRRASSIRVWMISAELRLRSRWTICSTRSSLNSSPA